MTPWDKYLNVEMKLRKRYTRPDGSLVLSIGGNPSRYAKLERLAAQKYLGITWKL